MYGDAPISIRCMQKNTSETRKPPVDATANQSDQPISFVVITLFESKFLANITTHITTVIQSSLTFN